MQFPNLRDIQRRRKILGLTQNQLAKRVGISQSLLTKIERGKVVPNYGIATEIFTVLEELENVDQKLAKDIMHKNVITLKPNDTVERAARLAKKYAISQFPVVEGHRQLGSVASSDLIWNSKSSKIRDIHKEPFPSVNETTPISVVKGILRSSRAVIVLNKGEITGIITADDLL